MNNTNHIVPVITVMILEKNSERVQKAKETIYRPMKVGMDVRNFIGPTLFLKPW